MLLRLQQAIADKSDPAGLLLASGDKAGPFQNELQAPGCCIQLQAISISSTVRQSQ
tara:strand:- start:317 stop:484 length:168 start_codon:yes stop_codon:yes gene_type:complete